ncbi:hypothetical protein MED222_06425 [Vibrio sp. MED222]|nr:hypothetical protein MED222_06425 [Vibrio sp. MED222]
MLRRICGSAPLIRASIFDAGDGPNSINLNWNVGCSNLLAKSLSSPSRTLNMVSRSVVRTCS